MFCAFDVCIFLLAVVISPPHSVLLSDVLLLVSGILDELILLLHPPVCMGHGAQLMALVCMRVEKTVS